MTDILLKDRRAVILCGGRGSRLGSITESLPKPLVNIHDKPILWYTFLNLYKHGFRNFIFPLGYKGIMIKDFIVKEFAEYNCGFKFVDTGEDSPISVRLDRIYNLLPEGDDFFMLNGDTFFDFDITGMYQFHLRKNALLTLSSVEIIPPYGIIVEKNSEIIDFSRSRKISYFSLDSVQALQGYVNAGLVWLNKEALNLVNLKQCKDLERELYPKIVYNKRAAHYKIEGNWFAIDTQKDLSIINSEIESHHKIGVIVKETKKNLEGRYSYRTRYYQDVNELKEKILNKTIIPHQVEVQPGPLTKGRLCWLPCPYCYGNSAQDTGERLSPSRYLEIMRQIAEGGVNKIIFAGYATDPLNYAHIEDLLQASRDYNQIFGFHTKALRISDRFIEQATSPSIVSLSYFSVSVDAGSNQIYNKVHGLKDSGNKLYDRVLENISRLCVARAKTAAPLDISITYLINNLNNSTQEVLKNIEDFKQAGVDLIRFTFPQVPRGYKRGVGDKNIPDRSQVLSYVERLKPVIEGANSGECQVLILDLDAEYDVYQVARSLPCFARFIFPSIGFDGWLSHCSESAAPHFRDLVLGNLARRDFWDVFYDYDVADFNKDLEKYGKKMCNLGCKCDRKEHVVNNRISESKIFTNV